MERNYKNHIKWQEIGEDEYIEAKITEDGIPNPDEVKSVFSIGVTENLLSEEDLLLRDAIQINCSENLSEVTINLEIDRSSPYDITRNGTTVEEDVETFPFTETLDRSIVGEVDYEVENDSGNIDSCTVTHLPVATSCTISGSDVTISLDIDEAPPFSISRNGTEIASSLGRSDFPYNDSIPDGTSGSVTYEVFNSEGYTDTCEVYPVEISASYSDPEATITLDINSAGPYVLRREGVEIEESLAAVDFPYVDDLGQTTGIVNFEVVNIEGNADSATVTI